MRKVFYVCSYGGCGSKMLCSALKKYGKVRHIHSRKPPTNLEYIGKEHGGTVYSEWFNGIPIPKDDINRYHVIYIYRNPVKAIISRFRIRKHLYHVQADMDITMDDVVETKKDLYGVEEFYTNYVTPAKNRNYKIYCVRYEDIFRKQNKLSRMLGIGALNLVRKEKYRAEKEEKYAEKLGEIYQSLNDKMKQNPPIMIV